MRKALREKTPISDISGNNSCKSRMDAGSLANGDADGKQLEDHIFGMHSVTVAAVAATTRQRP
jgi:hypothetical protein